MTMPEFPEGWRPSGVGDSIEGTITDIEQGWSDQSSSFYPILILNTGSEKKTAVHCFHTALKRGIVGKRAKPGDYIKITVGKKRPLKSNPSHTVVPYFVEFPKRTAADFNPDEFYRNMGGGRPVSRRAAQSDIPTGLEDDDGEDIPY